MTANEARSKWCPMARCTFENITGNRLWSDVLSGQDPHCIADECACWVWNRKVTFAPGDNGFEALPHEDWQGHCGLVR